MPFQEDAMTNPKMMRFQGKISSRQLGDVQSPKGTPDEPFESHASARGPIELQFPPNYRMDSHPTGFVSWTETVGSRAQRTAVALATDSWESVYAIVTVMGESRSSFCGGIGEVEEEEEEIESVCRLLSIQRLACTGREQ
ncbi:hypothetical protein CRG98_000271 [Punica granatum]|uniref:Uncharacterized protein n=1 Tax=Punica granatum TaxID=22663 RepID=A0A2I0LG30_PUNGR|nr:hypothetical protein CRG98_000271 [Punica granatum]